MLIFHDCSVQTDSSDELKWKHTCQYTSYVVAGIAVLFSCLVICLRSRIKMAIEVVESASRAIEDIPMMTFFPLWSLLTSLLLFAAWAYVTAYLYATSSLQNKDIPDGVGHIFYNEGRISTDKKYQAFDYKETTETKFASHFFVLLWVLSIVHYFTYMIVSGVVADWYFTPRDAQSGKKLRHNKQDADYDDEIHLTATPICDAVWRTLRHHLGTVVFAALIISVIKFVRWFVMYQVKLMDYGKKRCSCLSKLHACLECLKQCLLKWLECLLDKVNKNALIYCAIYGDAFCPSVCGSFKLVWSNLIRAAFMSLVSKIVTKLGTMMITLVTVGLSFCILTYLYPRVADEGYNELSSPILPLCIIGLIAFVVSKLFLAVYDTAIDTVFLCFLVDEKQNKDNGCMLADEGLKAVVSNYEEEAKAHAKNAPRFRHRAATGSVTAQRKDTTTDTEVNI